MSQQISQTHYLTTCPQISWQPVGSPIGRPSSILKSGITNRLNITWFEFLSLNRVPSIGQLTELYHQKGETLQRLDRSVFLRQSKSRLSYLIPVKLVTKQLVVFQNHGGTLYVVHLCQQNETGLTQYQNSWVSFVEEFSSHLDKQIYKMVIAYEKDQGKVMGKLCEEFINDRLLRVTELIQRLPRSLLIRTVESEVKKINVESDTLIDQMTKPSSSSLKEDPSFSEEHLRFPKLSTKEKAAFHQMQQRFPTVPDNDLCRFLIAKSFNLEAATQMYTEYLHWREESSQKYTMESFKEITDKRMFMYCGKDYKGRVVVFNEAALVVPSELNQDLYCEFYTYYFQIYIASKMTGYADQLIILANGKNLGMRNFKISLTKRNMQDLLKNCPQRQARLIAVNANWFGTSVWTILRPLLPEKSAKKIQVYGCNQEQNLAKLQQIMHRSVIPECLGGTNRMVDNY